MALVLADRVKESTTTAGTGTVTLLGAATGFQSFAVIGNGNTTYYTIAGQTTSEWEVGIGTYTSSGTTLARTTVLANSAGTQPTALTFSAGTKDVFVTYPAGKSVNQDASGNVGIGTSSPGAILHTIKTSAGAATVGAFIQNSDTTVGTEVRLGFAANINTVSDNRYGWIGYVNTGGTNGGALTFATTPGGAAATERMRITSAGGVSFGATGTAYGTSGQVLTSAGDAPPTWTTATSANTASAIVQRDASGNFTAGTITAALTGTASGNLVSGGALGTPSSGTLTNCTFPTLNQNTTGSAATFTSTTQNSQFNSIGVGTAASATAGEIRATNNITAYYSSDIKFKENVRDIPNALATVNAIGGKLFDWNDAYIESRGGADGYFVQKADFGVIAQDVQKVFPIAVRTREDGSLAVDYEKLSVLAFAALVEITKRVEALEDK